jgi:hypothetical protein
VVLEGWGRGDKRGESTHAPEQCDEETEAASACLLTQYKCPAANKQAFSLGNWGKRLFRAETENSLAS